MLLANAAVVMVGAVFGTWITTVLVRRAPDEHILQLAGLFATVGIVLSVLVNAFMLRAAFRPLTDLRSAAQAVRHGNLDARAAISSEGDWEIQELAETLNATLDELSHDRAELRSLSSQVIRAQEEERRRIARDLHDDTAQLLFAQLLRVTALQSSPSPQVQQLGRDLEESTVEALEGVRRLALELRPPALDDLGLAEALADLAQRFQNQTGTATDYQVRGSRGRLPADIELVLYRIAQEALTNVAKHAQASAVVIDLERSATDVSLSVRDDGRGFSPEAAVERREPGLGLFGMQERASLVGGTLRVWSEPGKGTEVFAYIPLDERAAAESVAVGAAVREQ